MVPRVRGIGSGTIRFEQIYWWIFFDGRRKRGRFFFWGEETSIVFWISISISVDFEGDEIPIRCSSFFFDCYFSVAEKLVRLASDGGECRLRWVTVIVEGVEIDRRPGKWAFDDGIGIGIFRYRDDGGIKTGWGNGCVEERRLRPEK